MKKSTAFMLFALLTVTAIAVTFMLSPIPQDLLYHQFADNKTIAGIPNCLNVISNLPFLFFGAVGLSRLAKSTAPAPVNRMYAIIFSGIILTGLGSAYYHYAPGNNTLVYDRIPMTIVFMAFLAATIAAWIDIKAGNALLLPLLVLGIGSVLYWNYTEIHGRGDLRLYGFIQFYPMIIIPLIFLLFASPQNNKGLYLLVWVIIWYGVAKLFEMFDRNIYTATGFVSGHSLKHIAAAIATWYMVKFFDKKYTGVG